MIKFLTKYLLLSLLSIAAMPYAWGQTEQLAVKGKVVDQTGAPIAGVAIIVQEKTSGVTSDAEGKFAIEASSNDRIVFKMNGYNTAFIPAYEVSETKPIKLQKSQIEAGDDDNVYIPFGLRKKTRNNGNHYYGEQPGVTANTAFNLKQCINGTLVWLAHSANR